MGFGTGGGDPGDFAKGLWDGAMQGLLQGVTNIGLNYATQELGLNPLVANIGFSAISLGIESAINGSGIFEHIFGTYEKNVLTTLGYNPKPEKVDFYQKDNYGMIIPGTFNQAQYNVSLGQYYWQESVYTSQILDFSEIVREQGLVNALNTYATGFFNSTSINSMVNIAGSIGEYITHKLNLGEYVAEIMKDGTTAKRVDIENSDESVLIGGEDGLEWLKGKVFLGGVVYGNLGVDAYNELGLAGGYFNGNYADGTDYYMDVYKTNPSVVWIGSGDETYVRINPFENNTNMEYTSSGALNNSEVWDYITGRTINYYDDHIGGVSLFNNISENIYLTDSEALLNLTDTTFNDLFNASGNDTSSSIFTEMQNWVTSMGGFVDTPEYIAKMDSSEFKNYLNSNIQNETKRQYLSDLFDSKTIDGKMPSIDLVFETQPIIERKNFFGGRINFDLTARAKVHFEGDSNVQLDIDAVSADPIVKAANVKWDFSGDRFNGSVYMGSDIDPNLIPDFGVGGSISAPLPGDSIYNITVDTRGEFLTDINQDGYYSMALDLGVDAGAASSGVTLNIDVHKDTIDAAGPVAGIVLITIGLAALTSGLITGKLALEGATAAAVIYIGTQALKNTLSYMGDNTI